MRKGLLGIVTLFMLAALLVGLAVAPIVQSIPTTADEVIIRNNAINGDDPTLVKVEAVDKIAAEVAREQADQGKGKNHFGWNVYEAASRHITAGDYDNVLDYVYRANDGEGDFVWALRSDPCLAAAIITNYVNVINPTDKILKDDTWQQPVGQQPNYVADAFLADHAYWQESVEAFLVVLADNANAHVEEIDDYTSSMYMYHNGRGINLPDIVVRNSTNAGGHVLVFDFDKAGVLKFRLECGYQPIEVDYWTPPGDTPPEDDLEPKDPDAGPQGQVPNNPDFGGGPNHDNDTTITTEPTSPESYTPPQPPTDDNGGDNSGDKTTETTAPPEDIGDRHNDGGTEEVDGEEYEVVVGEEEEDIDDVQEDHDSDTVEDPLKDDNNTGSIEAPE